MDCSAPGFPVLHCLPELAQTRVHWVGDTIQPSYLCHPLLLLLSTFPSIRVFFFPNESVFRISFIGASVSASVLPVNIQGWFLLELTGLISLHSKGLLKVFSSTISLKASILWHSVLDSKNFNIRNILGLILQGVFAMVPAHGELFSCIYLWFYFIYLFYFHGSWNVFSKASLMSEVKVWVIYACQTWKLTHEIDISPLHKIHG